MPARSFVPVPLVEAQPRVYKSFRGRQLKGIMFGLAGAAMSLWVFGVQDFAGYLATFLLAVPGFAYGYYHPQGKPVEYWARVYFRYYAKPQLLTAHKPAKRPRLNLVLRAVVTLLTWHVSNRKEGSRNG